VLTHRRRTGLAHDLARVVAQVGLVVAEGTVGDEDLVHVAQTVPVPIASEGRGEVGVELGQVLGLLRAEPGEELCRGLLATILGGDLVGGHTPRLGLDAGSPVVDVPQDAGDREVFVPGVEQTEGRHFSGASEPQVGAPDPVVRLEVPVVAPEVTEVGLGIPVVIRDEHGRELGEALDEAVRGALVGVAAVVAVAEAGWRRGHRRCVVQAIGGVIPL